MPPDCRPCGRSRRTGCRSRAETSATRTVLKVMFTLRPGATSRRPPQFPAQYPQNQNGIRTNGIPSHPHAPDWNPQMMFSGQRQAPLKEERPFDGMGSDRGLRSIFDWGNQPQGQAGGDRRLQSHSSGTWSPAPAGLSPYGMSSPGPFCGNAVTRTDARPQSLIPLPEPICCQSEPVPQLPAILIFYFCT